MRILKFRINGQKLSKDGDFSNLVAGTKGYLKAAFNFSTDWDRCRKAAVFLKYGEPYPVPIINGICEIPEEISGQKHWKLYLIGERDGYRIVTNSEEVYQN